MTEDDFEFLMQVAQWGDWQVAYEWWIFWGNEFPAQGARSPVPPASPAQF